MSQVLSPKQEEEKQTRLNEAENKNKVLVEGLAAIINRLNGQIKDGITTTSSCGTGKAGTSKTTRASTGISDTISKKETSNTTKLVGGVAATIASSLNSKSGTNNANDGNIKDRISTGKTGINRHDFNCAFICCWYWC